MKKGLAGILTGSLLFIGTTLSVGAVEDDRDCGDFDSHEAVESFWAENGYNAENDPHRLDGDSDGEACEEYDYTATSNGNDSSDGTSDEQQEAADEQESTVEENEEEGAALPETGSNGPLMMLFGAGVAGAGSLLLFRRKSKTA